MSGEDGAVSSGSYRRKGSFGSVLSNRLLYPVGATVAIFLVLATWARHAAGDPNRLFNVFQMTAVVFFVSLLFRLLLHPGQQALDECDSSRAIGEVSVRVGIWIALAAGAISYLRTLPLNFFCDDFGYLEQIRRPFAVAIWPEFTKGQDGVFYRPLAFVSFFVDYHLWHRWAPGYHLTSILLHLVCIAGVFNLCKQLGLKRRTCIAASIFFAVIPVGVQAVTWTSARFDQLAAAFGIWSIAFAANFRRIGQLRFYWVALGLFVFAVLSKENAYIFPVLWAAFELLQNKAEVPKRSLRRTVAIWAGYLSAPAILMLYRLTLFGDIGGYRDSNAPIASHFAFASILGLLVRAPGEMLFGWDWLASGSQLWITVAVLTAAIFLMLALRMKTGSNSRRLILFALIWIFISAAPAHFYFWAPDPGLFVSRTLYFGAMGLAILIAVLLDESFSQSRMYQAWAALIGLLLFAGTQHNISAWQRAAGDAKIWLGELKQEQPSPPPGVTYYIRGIPDQDLGVPFFAAGLESAVRSQYSWREDIHVVTDRSSAIPPSAVVVWYHQPER